MASTISAIETTITFGPTFEKASEANPDVYFAKVDATSNLGKPNYWLARRGMKLATLIVSVLFFLVLLIYLLLARA